MFAASSSDLAMSRWSASVVGLNVPAGMWFTAYPVSPLLFTAYTLHGLPLLQVCPSRHPLFDRLVLAFDAKTVTVRNTHQSIDGHLIHVAAVTPLMETGNLASRRWTLPDDNDTGILSRLHCRISEHMQLTI